VISGAEAGEGTRLADGAVRRRPPKRRKPRTPPAWALPRAPSPVSPAPVAPAPVPNGASAPAAAAVPAAAAAPKPQDEPSSGSLPQLARLLGGVIAPTSLLTGLLYYFGWLHAYYLFDYFGVNSTALGFGSADYLMRSVDALYMPLTVAAIVTLLALWGHSALLPQLRAGSREFRTLFLRLVTGLGIVTTVTCGALTLAIGAQSGAYVALAPVGFGAGVVVLAYSVHMRRILGREGHTAALVSGWGEAAEWMITFFLIGLSLFTAATDYAGGVGVSRARELASELPAQPGVVVYSKQSLDLPRANVTETRCRSSDAAYGYRYDGLVLVLESSGKYLLLPRTWTRAGSSAAILLQEGDAIRLEFYPAGASPAASPAGC
jgi:hypothetical protein